MPKILNRIAAFLLIPCLLVDPSVASGSVPRPSDAHTAFGNDTNTLEMSPILREQALQTALVQGFDGAMETMARKIGIRLRKDEGYESVESDAPRRSPGRLRQFIDQLSAFTGYGQYALVWPVKEFGADANFGPTIGGLLPVIRRKPSFHMIFKNDHDGPPGPRTATRPPQEYPFDRLVIPVKLWAEAFASANVLRELREAGISLPVEIVASPMYLKGEELGRMRDLFANLENVAVVSRAQDRPKAFPKSLFITFVDRPSTAVENNVAEMPIELLKTLFEPVPPENSERLRQELQINRNTPVLVMGSISLDEKGVMLRICQELLRQPDGPRILLVPRHSGDLQAWVQALEQIGLPAALRIRLPDGRVQMIGDPASALVLNMTQGELRAFYSLADLAVIGNSFVGSSHGHNIAEAVALGVPILVGPSFRRNGRLAEAVIRLGAGKVVARSDLIGAIHQALGPAERLEGKRRAQGAAIVLKEEFIKPAVLPLIKLLNSSRGGEATIVGEDIPEAVPAPKPPQQRDSHAPERAA